MAGSFKNDAQRSRLGELREIDFRPARILPSLMCLLHN